jgi:hypothetical protein
MRSSLSIQEVAKILKGHTAAEILAAYMCVEMCRILFERLRQRYMDGEQVEQVEQVKQSSNI